MRSMLLGIFIGTASGCSDPVAEAQRDIEFVQNAGSLDDICHSYAKLEDVALKARNASKLLEAKIRRETACANARTGYDPRLKAQIKSDNMDIGT